MKNPGANTPGCLGRNVGRNRPREAPLLLSSLIGRGRKQCASVAGPLWTFAGPESSGPPTPHPVAVCDCEGLAACLATRRRISGFVDCKTEIAPDRQDGGSTCWIRQDRLRLAAVVVRANEHRLVVVLVRDPVAIRIS